jgi:hypothetical protein
MDKVIAVQAHWRLEQLSRCKPSAQVHSKSTRKQQPLSLLISCFKNGRRTGLKHGPKALVEE